MKRLILLLHCVQNLKVFLPEPSGPHKKVNRTTKTIFSMNEIKLVIFGLITLVIAAILLWALDEPEILVDKEIELAIALGVGLLILILDRRADRRIHEIIHEQHLLINKMNKKIDEQNELIKNIQKISSSSHKDHGSNKDS